jgi:transcription termination factor Rho
MDFRELLEQQKRNKEQKQKQYEEDSKGRLLKIGSKQIRTTMIGALDIIEKNFGFLWNHNGQPQTDEQLLFKEKYEEVRKSILDKGNQQIHNFSQEIQQYQIIWKRYSITLPVVNTRTTLENPNKE